MKMNYFKFGCIAALLISVGLLCACGKNISSPEESVDEKETLKEIKADIGKYEGLEVTIEDMAEVTDADVEEQLKLLIESTEADDIDAEKVIETGDLISISYECYVENEPYGEGETNFYLTVGSGAFLENVDELFPGKKGGDMIDAPIQCGEDYPVEELRGKAIVYKITINGVVTQVAGTLTDEYIASISDYDTVDEFREMLKKSMIENNEAQKKMRIVQAVLDILYDQIDIDDFSESLREQMVEKMMAADREAAALENTSIEEYVEGKLNMSMEEYKKQMSDAADQQIKYNYIIETIAEKEGITTDDMTEQEWLACANQYGFETVEELRANYDQKELEELITAQKVQDYLVSVTKVNIR